MASKAEITPIVDADATTMNGSEPGGTYTATQEDGHDLFNAASLLTTVYIHATPGGTTPTLDVRLQHSADRAQWITLDDFTQITIAGTTGLTVPNADVAAFGRYVRVQYKTGGTTPEFVVTCTLGGKE